MFKDKTVVACKRQVSVDMQGESVILNLASGTYFGLNVVGGRIWELVQQPVSVKQIEQAILDEYVVEPERCAQDIEALLAKLTDAGLLEVVDAAAP